MTVSDRTAPSQSNSSAFRPDIEGLRGVAVLIVVAFHCAIPGFSAGFVGVDVFFVLSGYLITGHLVAETQRTSRLSLRNFYARRVRRLLPASALVLAFTLVASVVLLAPQEIVFTARAARATAVYLSNVFFSMNASDYFAPNVETNPMLHTWTLAVEEQFYVVWPVLIMIGLVYFRSRRVLLGLLVGLTVLSLGISIWATGAARSFAFYQLPARAWEFAIGGLAVLLPPGKPSMPRAGWIVIGWVGLASILLFEALVSPRSAFPGWIALVPVVGTAAVLVAGAARPGGGVARVLDVRPLQFLGKLSYSWYLWHWPFLVLIAALVPNVSFVGKGVAALLSLVVATVAYHLVENPIRFNRRLVQRPVLTLGLAALLMVFSIAIAQLSLKFANRLTRDPGLQRIAASVDDIADMPRTQCVSLGNDAAVSTCVFGDTTSTTNVVLFGDSHAIQWFDPIERVAAAHSWKLTTMLKSGCAAADAVLDAHDQGFINGCAAWRRSAIQRIVGLRPALVIIASSTGWRREKGGAPQRRLDAWGAGLARTLSGLSRASAPIAVMRDTPAVPFDVPTCLARSFRHRWYPGGSCEFARAAAVDETVFEVERRAGVEAPGVQFIDMTPELCGVARCQSSRDGMVMYRDDNHLTGKFAGTLDTALGRELMGVVGSR